MSTVYVIGTRLYTNTFSCKVSHGLNGFTVDKNEGDMCTPVGEYTFQRLYYRPDRVAEPLTKLPTGVIAENSGWCDDPTAPYYNSYVKLPSEYRHEKLWRKDHLYDIVLIISHNLNPAIPGKGSAVFFHLWRNEGSPTAGCIAMERENILRLCREISPGDSVVIQPFP